MCRSADSGAPGDARAASPLNHPNIVIIHDFGETDEGDAFIVQEFIAGNTLRQRLGAAARRKQPDGRSRAPLRKPRWQWPCYIKDSHVQPRRGLIGRRLTEDEKYAIIEYLKTRNDDTGGFVPTFAPRLPGKC